MTGRSALTDPVVSEPTQPGMLNTVSTSTAPPSSVPMSIPSTVTIGVIAERTPWRRITRRSGNPLARAVRM